MFHAPPKRFFIEGGKITTFCLMIIGVLYWFGASKNLLLVAFNMSVMSNAATFSPGGKKFVHLLLGSGVIVLSIIIGGLLGFYIPVLAHICIILYAGLAFLFSKTRTILTIFVSGAIMFLVFSSLSFDIKNAANYLFLGILFILAFVGFHTLFDSKVRVQPKNLPQAQKQTSIVVVISLGASWILSHYLFTHTPLSHIYWMGLTILVVIQGSYQQMIKTSLARIGINTVGAISIVLLFNYVIPEIFLINFALMILFLFLIFAVGYSYFWRTFFIELYVLAFAHLLIGQQEQLAFERILLTLMGGSIVIVVTIATRFFLRLIKKEE